MARYDGELQMFVETTREPSEKHLEFTKWLRANGRMSLRDGDSDLLSQERPSVMDGGRVDRATVKPLEIKKYDASLQMFVEAPKELDLSRLRFLRWMGERGRLEHKVAGPVSGPLVARAWRPEV